MFEGRDAAYLVFGVKDDTHEIVGTQVDLGGAAVGTEKFLFWLNKYLEPHINVSLKSFEYQDRKVEMLCIEPGYQQPVKFKGVAFIRIDSNQQPLSNYPEKERAIWQITSRFAYENTTLLSHLECDDLFADFYIDKLLLNMRYTGSTQKQALSFLMGHHLIKDNMQGGFEVTTLLAITSAKNLNVYGLTEGKDIRVISYAGRDKLEAATDRTGSRGYTVSFSSLLKYIMGLIPSEEVILHGIRSRQYKIPEVAIREFLANALIHQDFTVSGARPIIEIYKDKVRIINPGVPLVETDRFIDAPSRSRNPRFGKIMRDAGLCEERGSGVDRAIAAIEKAALPPPLIQVVEGSTVVTVFMPRSFADMTPDERVRACYQHACISYERAEPMSNGSLRIRFGLSQRQYPQVSQVIRDSIAANRIRPQDEDQANRNARYVPFYA